MLCIYIYQIGELHLSIRVQYQMTYNPLSAGHEDALVVASDKPP